MQRRWAPSSAPPAPGRAQAGCDTDALAERMRAHSTAAQLPQTQITAQDPKAGLQLWESTSV